MLCQHVDMKKYLSRLEVAKRIGVSTVTLDQYAQRGSFPEPDVMIGSTRGWSEATVRRVIEDRERSPRVQRRRVMAGAVDE